MHETINPYRTGAGLILKKIRWDLSLSSHRSASNLKKLKGRFKDKKAVILCNGPSLNKVDFGLLDGTFCFGLNKINLLFSRTTFRPSAIVAINPYVIEQNAEFYNETNIPLYLDSYAHRKKLVFSRSNVTYLYSGPRGFARDCSNAIYPGNTVTYVALQLAFHLGFESVALVGCDHNFSTKGPANKLVIAGDSDPNHFDPNYFANVPWQLPDLAESEASYAQALRSYTEHGRRLYNCTDGGKLELLPRKGLSEFLSEKR